MNTWERLGILVVAVAMWVSFIAFVVMPAMHQAAAEIALQAGAK